MAGAFHHDRVSNPKPPHKKKSRSGPTNCEACDCDDLPGCNLGLFSFLLTLGSVAAGVSRVPALDRAGRAAILGYRRFLSPHWPGRCGYTPTCSAYGLAAVERYGLAAGGRLAADRLRRCTPRVPLGTHDPLR